MILSATATTSGLQEFCERVSQRFPLACDAIRAAAGDNLRTLVRGEALTRRGDQANAAWIIERGEIDIGSPRIRVRRKAELVGEAGLLRPGSTRTADMIASGPAAVWCISREAVSRLPAEERASIFEVIASGLLDKLEQAVDQRHEQMADIDGREKLLRAFVPASGLGLIRARLFNAPDAKQIHRKSQAIIWFSDIAGFSALTKQMTAEDAGAAAVALQTPIIDAITDAGGELDKLMGDGAMAFWLAPGADVESEQAGSAVEAALQAVRQVKEVAAHNGWEGVHVRIGIHCGEVLVGDFGAAGRRSFTSIGAVVNTAARYEQARQTYTGKPLGPVRISPQLWSYLPPPQRDHFERKAKRFKEKFPPMLQVHRLKQSLIGELS